MNLSLYHVYEDVNQFVVLVLVPLGSSDLDD